jgi:energy-coupling factor transport system ATP-binding protein
MRIEFTDVAFAYRRRDSPPHQVLKDFSLTVAPAESVALLGREGAGKSTLLHLSDGLLLPDHGTVRVRGVDAARDQKRFHDIRGKIGFAFQFPEQQFFCDTVEDEMMEFFRNRPDRGKPSREQLERILTDVGLSPERFLSRSPFSLSMGEARRLMLACIVLSRPDLLLVDEITAGLDAGGTELVLSVLAKMHRHGTTLVIASHDTNFLAEIAGRVVVVDEGRVMLDVFAKEFFPNRDLLSRFGFRMPDVIALTERLRSEGLPIPPGFFRYHDLRRTLESIRGR